MALFLMKSRPESENMILIALPFQRGEMVVHLMLTNVSFAEFL
jgi:hypothetical protein